MRAISGELFFRQCSYKRMLENESKSITKAPTEAAKELHRIRRDIEDSALAREFGLTLDDIV